MHVFVIFILLLGIQKSASANDLKAEDVMELKIRDGLPNFFHKASQEDTIRIAYLGGSITAQKGWRVYSFEWFKEIFPKVNFIEINAAIGGTGSDFGAFRLQEHVLSQNPDLVFVEFAVNDDDKAEQRIYRSMESIVRGIWNNNSETDVCFIYTLKGDFLEAEMNGNLPHSAQIMEKVAEWYGIPTINFGKEVCRLTKDSLLVFKGKEKKINDIEVFSPDGVHPYLETGHRIYFHTLKKSFKKISKKSSKKVSVINDRNAIKPLVPNYYEAPQMISFKTANLSENWKITKIKNYPELNKFEDRLTEIGVAAPGESLTFKFKGTAVGIYDIMGPSAGRVILEIDGLPKDTIYRFDKYSTYYRMNYLLFDNLKDQEHEVVFKVMPGRFNKADILDKIGNKMENPDEYSENNWYVGKLLVNGVLQE